MTLIEQLGDIKTKASLSNNIGSLLESQGHLTEALQYYQQALAMAEQLNDIRTKAYCLNNIGSVLKLQGHSNEVLSYYQQALTIFKDLKAVREIEILEKKISAINKDLECSEKKSG